MSSKFAFPIALIVSTSLSGCGIFFNDDRKPNEPMEVGDQSFSCVRSIGTDLKAYLNGADNDPSLAASCLNRSLTKFAKDTRGRTSPDGWTRSELTTFFETYFKAESERSPQTLVSRVEDILGFRDKALKPFDTSWTAQAKRRVIVSEIFRWKAILLGGTDQTLTREELSRFIRLLDRATPHLASLKGQGKVISLLTEDGDTFAAARVEQVVAAQRSLVGLVLAEFASSPIEQRRSMKLENFFGAFEQAGSHIFDLAPRRELISAVKTFAVNGNPWLIEPDEWTDLIKTASEVWIAAMRVKLEMVANPDFLSRDFELIRPMAQDFVAAMKPVLNRSSGVIELDRFDRLFAALEKNSLLGPLSARAVSDTLRPVLDKLLSTQSVASVTGGMQVTHLSKILDVVEDWIEGQRLASELVGASGSTSVDSARRKISTLVSKDDASKETPVTRAHAQMHELLTRGRPLVHDSEGRLVILPDSEYQVIESIDLSILNATRVLVSMALRGFSKEPSRAGLLPKVSEEETQEIFMAMKPIGRDLGIVDVRSLNSGSRTFMEANIFLSVSDGDAWMSFHETIEWFEFVISAGLVSDRIHSDLAAPCGTKELDVFGKPRLAAGCVRDRFWESFERRAGHLKMMVAALQSARSFEKAGSKGFFGNLNWKKGAMRSRNTPSGPEGLLRTLERASRPLGDTDLAIDSSEIRVMLPISHYIESLFARFDADRSGQLEEREVWSAFPLIRPFMSKFASKKTVVSLRPPPQRAQPPSIAAGAPDRGERPKSNAEEPLAEWKARGVFSWIIVHGEPPDTKSKLGKLNFLKWVAIQGLYSQDADVEDIIKILASFAKVGRDGKNEAAQDEFKVDREVWSDGIENSDPRVLARIRSVFQCAEQAEPSLTRLVQSRRSELFKVKPESDADQQALEFVDRLKSMIQNDPQLVYLCQAF